MLKKPLLVFASLLMTSLCWASQPHYTIIIDAGSSGSRLHLFQHEKTDALPRIQDLYSEKIKPGLSSFADHPEAAAESLKPVLDHAQKELEVRGIDSKNASIQILATAGMRLLPAAKAQAIYQNIQQYLNDHYLFKVDTIETISDKLEGLYGWLDVNFIAHRFEADAQSTLGTLDLGGASTEIAFANETSISPEDEIQLDINQRHYIVYTKSFLSLGQDVTRSAMNQSPDAGYCYPTGYPLDTQITGNFQFQNCKNLFKPIISKQISGQLPSLSNKKFVAFSAFYYTTHFFSAEKLTDQTALEARIQTVCQSSWEELKKNYPDVPEKYSSHYCASGAYLSDLMYETYHLDGSQIQFTNKVGQHEIDWPLGALLYQLI